MKQASNFGILVALLVISCWMASLFSLLQWEFSWRNPLVYIMILVQTHLYTGLFITAHDAMHGTVSSSRKFNIIIGQVCTALYAAFSFKKLMVKHHQHHRHVHSDQDPDYHEGPFLIWYFHFMKEYMSVLQLIMMAVLFNVLTIWFSESNILLFWVAPALLSTLQLFYFGTWQPHHGEHQNIHHSRTLKKNHLAGFFSCYFFGYHYEHHEWPGVPWWKLWRMK
ncbi:MAG: fatty acid desaturase [Arcticibacter sp.]